MHDSLERWITIKQLETESLNDYTKRFKQLRDTATSYVDKKIFDEFIENSEAYKNETDATKQQEMKDGAFNEYSAYLLINGSLQSKYGNLKQNFISQFSLGTDQYPKTIDTAVDALSQHNWDQKYFDNKAKRREHQQQQQPDESEGATSFAQADKFCYVCGKPDHIAPNCPKKSSTTKNDWYINKAHQHMQNDNDGNSNDEYEADSDDQSTQSTSTSSSRNCRSGTP